MWDKLDGVEDTNLDYKERLEENRPHSWLKSVSAFANTRGGSIILGVRDKDHSIVGIDNIQYVSSKISEFISRKIEPAVQYELHDLKYPGDKYCLEIKVFNGPDYPYYYIQDKAKTAYVRRGDRSEPATAIELSHLVLRGLNKTFDMLPSHYLLNDISFTLFRATYNGVAEESLEMPRDLQSMKLIDESERVTYGGLLLCDQGVLAQSKVVCTHWKGLEKGSVDEDAIDDKVFERESLISLLTDAESFVINNSKKSWSIRGIQREEKSDYPYRAVREALVNALIHRDYQNIGSEVHVDMFDDRTEITSPGGMMNGSRIQDLNLYKVPSMRRNEVISDIFGRLHFMERRGSGIQRILKSYEGFGKKPEFYSDSTMFCVVLPNQGYSKKDSKENQNDVENTGFTDFSNHVREIYHEQMALHIITFAGQLGKDQSFNRKKLSACLNVTENAASKIIRKGVDKGIIRKERRGSYYFIFD